jgi:hypothetical protein
MDGDVDDRGTLATAPGAIFLASAFPILSGTISCQRSRIAAMAGQSGKS